MIVGSFVIAARCFIHKRALIFATHMYKASGAIELTYGQTRCKAYSLAFLKDWQGQTSLHPLALAQSCIAKHQPPDFRLRQLIDWPHRSIDSLSFAFLFVEQDMKIEILKSARVVHDDLILKLDTRVIIPSGDQHSQRCTHYNDTAGLNNAYHF